MIIYSQNKSNKFRTVQKQSTNRNQEDQKMLTEERHSIITDTVNTRKSVTIAELCRILDVSASTVKRDLNILAEAGKITKVRGGAISLDESFSAVEKNVEEKSAICKIGRAHV